MSATMLAAGMGVSVLVFAAIFLVVVLILTSLGRRNFQKAVDEATAALDEEFTFPRKFEEAAAIKDLELQWADHFHMRDQSWKTASNAAIVFVGVVGLEIYKGAPYGVMIAAYTALILLSIVGGIVSMHHRQIQQKIKFPIIIRYEVLLGLVPAFKDIMVRHGGRGASTSTFIVVSHVVLGVIAALLLVVKILVAAQACQAQSLDCLVKPIAVKEAAEAPAPPLGQDDAP